MPISSHFWWKKGWNLLNLAPFLPTNWTKRLKNTHVFRGKPNNTTFTIFYKYLENVKRNNEDQSNVHKILNLDNCVEKNKNLETS